MFSSADLDAETVAHPFATVTTMMVRPTPEQVLLLAPDRAAAAAALVVAVPASWSAMGCDDGAVWGQFIASTAEPYNVAVDMSAEQHSPAYRCSCPSRKIPCKHALGLLLLHANELIVGARRLPFAAEWLRRRGAGGSDPGVGSHDGEITADVGAVSAAVGSKASAPTALLGDPQRQKRQVERAKRMRAGLIELDRWLADRIRSGLAAPELAEIATWDRAAQRLVDAQCGGLANRVKRVATKIGQNSCWHQGLLEELALLHALAVGALRTSSLPIDLADGIHAATGLTVAQAEVLGGVPTSGSWLIVGESRTREDRITVQRTWMCSPDTPTTWAMMLAFGAFGNEVTTEHLVGTCFTGDLHWYPGGIALRVLVGHLSNGAVLSLLPPPATSIAQAVAVAGWAVAQEPWLERYPMCVSATPTAVGSGRWVLADDSACLALDPAFQRLAELVCVAGGLPIRVMGEHGAEGFFPLTVWSNDIAIQL